MMDEMSMVDFLPKEKPIAQEKFDGG